MIEKEFSSGRYKCKIIRHPTMGHLCGYIGIPKDHPDWGKFYDDVDIKVHGGLTFCQQGGEDDQWEDKDIWWFGFDCAHAGDYVPTLGSLGLGTTEHKWTITDVELEIHSMVKQFMFRELIQKEEKE